MIDHNEIRNKLRGLYKITGDDWVLSFSVSLTEPTAPVAAIRSEDRENSTRYVFWGDTIEEAVNKAVEAVHREVILGKRVTPEAPFTNPDDHKPEPPWMPKE